MLCVRPLDSVLPVHTFKLSMALFINFAYEKENQRRSLDAKLCQFLHDSRRQFINSYSNSINMVTILKSSDKVTTRAPIPIIILNSWTKNMMGWILRKECKGFEHRMHSLLFSRFLSPAHHHSEVIYAPASIFALWSGWFSPTGNLPNKFGEKNSVGTIKQKKMVDNYSTFQK